MSASKDFSTRYKQLIDANKDKTLSVLVPELENEVKKQDDANKKDGVKDIDKVDLSSFNSDIDSMKKMDSNLKYSDWLLKAFGSGKSGGSSGSKGLLLNKVDEKSLELSAMSIDQSEWDDLREDIDYEGFNRAELLKEVHDLNLTDKQITKIVATIAFRGPKKAATISLKELGGYTYVDVGIKSTAAGKADPKSVTANRMMSLFPAEAAIGLKKMKCPGRDRGTPLPSWLQFPTAASLPMCRQLMMLHEEFSRRFSQTIKGKFKEDIYNSIATNKVEIESSTASFLKLNDNVLTIDEEKKFWKELED